MRLEEISFLLKILLAQAYVAGVKEAYKKQKDIGDIYWADLSAQMYAKEVVKEWV